MIYYSFIIILNDKINNILILLILFPSKGRTQNYFVICELWLEQAMLRINRKQQNTFFYIRMMKMLVMVFGQFASYLYEIYLRYCMFWLCWFAIVVNECTVTRQILNSVFAGSILNKIKQIKKFGMIFHEQWKWKQFL